MPRHARLRFLPDVSSARGAGGGRLGAASLAVLLLAGCASLPWSKPAAPTPQAPAPAAPPPRTFPPPAAAPASAPPGTAPAAVAAAGAASAPAAPATPPTPPGQPQPFATVIKDAKRVDGPIPLWQKDEKVWFELSPALLGKPMLLSPKLRSGIGQSFVLGGLMHYGQGGVGGAQIVEFRRVHNLVQMVARNTDLTAPAGTPSARAVEAAVSHSLLGSTPVASQPHPESKAVLVEANALFLTDMLGIGPQLQRAFRQGYAFDSRNSAITGARTSPAATILETQHHYYTASIAVPQPGSPPGTPAPTVPNWLPDARSLFIGLHFSIGPLPEQPMTPRRADPRVGLFATTRLDFGDDLARTPRTRLVNRWRLEKKDPQAALSEPVRPITFWVDRNVPLKYRGAITAGIVEWNKAFERIGFKDAIVVKQQPDDADFDTLDLGVASIRWMTNPEPSFGAIGPRHVDPRTGEILDADIGMESLSSRSVRTIRSQLISGVAAPAHPPHEGHEHCAYGDVAAEQLGYALDVLEARGEVDPASPQAESFVLDYLKDVTMHEVGHTLGLRHNFRASRVYTEAQLSDPEFTRANGTTGSVMEYNAINLPRPGERGGTPFQITLGPYDYWAIEYAYKPIAPPDEERELMRIAGRSAEPLLAFGTDEDSFLGIDPETIQLDLGNDPIVFARKRLDIARDLFRRQETRALRPDQDWSVLRRSITYAIGDVSRAVGVLTRQIGGVRTLRDFAGSGRDPLEPVPAAVQRQALELISNALLSSEAFKLSPQLQRRLAPDFFDRAEVPNVPTDFSVPQRLLDLQRGTLNALMSDAVAARMLDSEGKVSRPAEAFRLSELYARLTRDVWSELAGARDITAPRRELQREHVNRVAGTLLRPGSLSRADARSLLRVQARTLLGRIHAALQRGGLSAEAQAHLQDSAETLGAALAAPLQRQGV